MVLSCLILETAFQIESLQNYFHARFLLFLVGKLPFHVIVVLLPIILCVTIVMSFVCSRVRKTTRCNTCSVLVCSSAEPTNTRNKEISSWPFQRSLKVSHDAASAANAPFFSTFSYLKACNTAEYLRAFSLKAVLLICIPISQEVVRIPHFMYYFAHSDRQEHLIQYLALHSS